MAALLRSKGGLDRVQMEGESMLLTHVGALVGRAGALVTQTRAPGPAPPCSRVTVGR